MADRYKQLIKNEDIRGSFDCPVELRAFAIIYDAQVDQMLAQIKLRNCSSDSITRVAFTLLAYDQEGGIVDEIKKCCFDQMDVSPQADFGTQEPVPLSVKTAKNIDISIVSIQFSSGKTWAWEKGVQLSRWEERIPLSEELSEELAGEYVLLTCKQASYVPVEREDGWLCTCGAFNYEAEQCGACQLEKEKAFHDFEKEILEEELRKKKEAEAEKKEKRKTLKKLLIKTAIAVAAVVILALITAFVIVPYKQYRDALTLMKQEKYNDAINAFKELEDYKDSKDKIDECKNWQQYKEAELQLDKGNTYKAEEIFRELGSFADAETRAKDVKEERQKSIYEKAKGYLKDGYPEKAQNLFEELGNYSDAKQKAAEAGELAKANKYSEAEKLLTEGNYSKAYNIFSNLGEYKDASEKAVQANQKLQAEQKEAKLREVWNSPLSFKSDTEDGYYTFSFEWPESGSQPTVYFNDAQGDHKLTIKTISTSQMVLYDSRGITHTLTVNASGNYRWDWRSQNGIYFR